MVSMFHPERRSREDLLRQCETTGWRLKPTAENVIGPLERSVAVDVVLGLALGLIDFIQRQFGHQRIPLYIGTFELVCSGD